MEEIIKRFIVFFESDRISISRKIAIPLLVVVTILLLDNILGTSYFWINKMETDYIVKVEEAKKICESDSVLVSYFDKKIDNAINRQNVFQWFASLFKSTQIDNVKEIHETNLNDHLFSNIEKWFPEVVERNQMWHTITSSFFWLICLFVLVFSLFFALFENKTDTIVTLLSNIIGIGIVVFLIWITQWIFGLLPVILHRAYINYILQFIINIVLIIFAIKMLMRAKRKGLL